MALAKAGHLPAGSAATLSRALFIAIALVCFCVSSQLATNPGRSDGFEAAPLDHSTTVEGTTLSAGIRFLTVIDGKSHKSHILTLPPMSSTGIGTGSGSSHNEGVDRELVPMALFVLRFEATELSSKWRELDPDLTAVWCRRHWLHGLSLICPQPALSEADKLSQTVNQPPFLKVASFPYLLPTNAFRIHSTGVEQSGNRPEQLYSNRSVVVAFDLSESGQEYLADLHLADLRKCVLEFAPLANRTSTDKGMEGSRQGDTGPANASDFRQQPFPILFDHDGTRTRNSDILLQTAVESASNTHLTLAQVPCGQQVVRAETPSNSSAFNATDPSPRLNATEWKQVLATVSRLAHEVLHKLRKYHIEPAANFTQNTTQAKRAADQSSQNGAGAGAPRVTRSNRLSFTLPLAPTIASGGRRLMSFSESKSGASGASPEPRSKSQAQRSSVAHQSNHRNDDLEVLGSRKSPSAQKDDPVMLDRLQSAEVALLEVTSKLNEMAEGRLGVHSTTIYEVIINPCIQVSPTCFAPPYARRKVASIFRFVLEFLLRKCVWKTTSSSASFASSIFGRCSRRCSLKYCTGC